MDNINLSYSKYIPTYAGQPVEDIKLANKELAEKYIKNKSDMDALSVAAANIEVDEKDLQYKNQAIQDIDNDITGILDDGNYEYATNKVTNSAKKFFSNQALPKAQEAYKELKAINAATAARKDIDDNRKAIITEMNDKSYSGVQPLTKDPRDGYTYNLNPISVGEDINGTQTVLDEFFSKFESDSTSGGFTPKPGSGEFTYSEKYGRSWLTQEELMNEGIKYLNSHNKYNNRYKPLIKIDNYHNSNNNLYTEEYLKNNEVVLDPNGYVKGDGVFVAPDYIQANDKPGFSRTSKLKIYNKEEAYDKLKAEVLAEHPELRNIDIKENKLLLDNYIKEKSDFNKQVYNDVKGAAVAKSFLKTSYEKNWEEDQAYIRKKKEEEERTRPTPWDATENAKNNPSNMAGFNITSNEGGFWKSFIKDNVNTYFGGGVIDKVTKTIGDMRVKIMNDPNVSKEDKDKFDKAYNDGVTKIQNSAPFIPFSSNIINYMINDNLETTILEKDNRTTKVIENDYNNIVLGKGNSMNDIPSEYKDKMLKISNKYGTDFNKLPNNIKKEVGSIYKEGLENRSVQEIYTPVEKTEQDVLISLNTPKEVINNPNFKINGAPLADIMGNVIQGNMGNSKMIYDPTTGTYNSVNNYLKSNPNVTVKPGGRLRNTNSFQAGSLVLHKPDGTTLFVEGTDQDKYDNWDEWSTYQVDNNNNKEAKSPLYYEDSKKEGVYNTEEKVTRGNVPTKRVVKDINTGKYQLYIENDPRFDKNKPISNGTQNSFDSPEEIARIVKVIKSK